MEKTELRIGNWAKRDTQPKGFQIDINSLVRISNGRTDYEPIPLTEEWRKRCGFDQHNQVVLGERTIEWCNDKLLIWGEDGNSMAHCFHAPCKFVHTYQNLYHALTGEELTINEL